MTPAEHAARSKAKKKKFHLHPHWAPTLREVRNSLGLSLYDVKQATGIAESAMSRIERGTDPMLSTALKLAVYYGRPVEVLWPRLHQSVTVPTPATPEPPGPVVDQFETLMDGRH